jgi:5-methylcytosine-specific restriction endonuclease McrA
MVDLAILQWSSVPRHRDPIFERDGWRCAVPACSSRRNLHDHHVLFRSQGGGNARDNRITVCAAHHLHGLHTGRIRARGRAPSGIVWQLPFGDLLGDRYLARR